MFTALLIFLIKRWAPGIWHHPIKDKMSDHVGKR